MARPKGTNQLHKKQKSFRNRTLAGRWLHAAFGRIFCKRTIIVISEHKTQHVPFSAGIQLFGTVGALALVVWISYSSGSYMAAQQVIQEKERKLASSTLENKRVSAEFTMLKSDLQKLAANSKNGKTGDMAKQLAEQYSKPSVNATETASNDGLGSEYDAILKRVEYLDNKVKELQSSHDEMMADIRATTGGKIQELEKVIARTGVAEQPLEKAAEAQRSQDQQQHEKYSRTENAAKGKESDEGGQGGPFIPESRASALKEKETELYYNLQRMMALNDIVNNLPLDAPLKADTYHQTSPFGVRSDPFRGESAFHSGLDLSGPEHAKVMATQDGKVEFSGWKTAYGNVVDIKHQYGLSTRYAHLERVLVQPEQYVKKGQVIGIQGSTGRSTGHHLHYEVRYNGNPINPSNFLKAGEDVRTN